MSEQIEAAAEFFGIIEPFNNLLALTKNSALIGAVELTGRDPGGFSHEDHAALCAISQSIYNKLHRSITITEYFTRFDGAKIQLRPRNDPVSDTLSKSRMDYLNSKTLSTSRIIHYFEIDPDDNLNKPNLTSTLKNLGTAIFDKKSRLILKNSISRDKMFLIEMEQLDRMEAQLQGAISEVVAKWGGLFGARQLSMQEIWAHMKFLGGMDPSALERGLAEAIPEEDLDIYVSSGDITNVQVDQMEVMKFAGVTTRYAKIGSVRRFAQARGKMQPGLWAAHEKSPMRLSGNFILMTRWRPLSEFNKQSLFSSKTNELERSSLSFFKIMKGDENQSALERDAGMKPAIKAKLEELGIAESIPDAWGIGNSIVVVFGERPAEIRNTALAMSGALGNANVNITWESVSIQNAFAALQPGQGRMSQRDLYLTSSQHAAASFLCQSSMGQNVIADMGNEEAAYVLQSKDGTPFYYSPYVNGRAMVIGIGPIRKGKTFLKNTFATHQQKYGGLYRAVDIDPGTEPIAGIFGKDGGIFRASEGSETGSNPFASCKGEDDVAFKIHLSNLLQLFLEANDAAAYQSITEDEQGPLDRAIDSTMRLPAHMQTLSALIHHMPEKLKVKFARWIHADPGVASSGAGWYAYLFDNEVDAIGKLDKKVGVFNLQALKDKPKLLKPVLADIIYRITSSFESEALRHVPKVLDIDECHLPLSLPGFPEKLVTWVRTWGKWFAMVQLWTQSPVELMKLEGWPALRSAATTFFFFSDPEMDSRVYREAFPFLTKGECDAIRSLTPQKEAYIIQPELGISKVVIIDVEPAQRVANTSHPREASLRDALIKEHGFEVGMKLAIQELTPVLIRDPEDDIISLTQQAQK